MAGLEDKVAIVTGAGTGIGRDIALALASQGTKVVAVGRRLEKTQQTCNLIAQGGGTSLAISADVSKATDVASLVEQCRSKFGTVDILVNNAAVVIPGKPSALKTTEEQWDKLMAINLKGVFLCAKAAAPIMLKNGWGRIVNISSVGGIVPSISAAYCASKAAVIALTKSMALELSPGGVTVNAVCPGTIVTDMVRDRLDDPQVRSAELKKSLVGRLGEPSDISAGILYLTSPHAAFITGSVLLIDGGWTIA